MNDLLTLSAARAASLIRQKKLSPVELTDAVLDAIEAAQPVLNAFVTITGELARYQAREAERAVMDGGPLPPLHGVPVSIKDQVETAGILTTHGSAIFADNVPVRDDAIAARLHAAGCILVGKTRMPEFGHKGLTDGPSFGTTPNPWDLSRTSGGSSGGAAAAVAAGLGPLALGTDGAGSVRIPAACCGVVGHKPTLGAVPWESALDAFGNYTYAGPITRTVTDAALMHAALSGPSARDPWTLTGKEQGRVSPGLIGMDLSGLRIGIVGLTANMHVDGDVAANTAASIGALEMLGAEAEPIGTPVDWIELPARVLYQANFAIAMDKHLARWENQMDPALLAFMERGRGFSMTEFREGQYARTRLFRAVQELLGRFDVLMMPTLTRSALPADFDAAHDQVEMDGKRWGITRQGWSAYVYPFNLTGHPALTVPSGFAADGLPTGVQIVGRWGADMDVLRLGAVLEAVRPWADKRPVAYRAGAAASV